MSKLPTTDSRKQFWQEQIKAWKASGKSQKAFCKANDLNYPRFGYWLRKLRKADSLSTDKLPSESAFVPVTLKTPSDSANASGLHLVLPGGLVIRGINGDNLPLVKQLLGMMR
ncbi:MAG TPA: hypothetical protein ENJ84_07670 [Gammaproteobacteria bacterium]|nr:hypothetical protein [Gammaproteobacteria bacterium]